MRYGGITHKGESGFMRFGAIWCVLVRLGAISCDLISKKNAPLNPAPPSRLGRLTAWQDRQEDIDPEFARLYGPYLLTLG